jgi:hypothetical protein
MIRLGMILAAAAVVAMSSLFEEFRVFREATNWWNSSYN